MRERVCLFVVRPSIAGCIWWANMVLVFIREQVYFLSNPKSTAGGLEMAASFSTVKLGFGL